MSENGATQEGMLADRFSEPGALNGSASALRPALAELLKACEYSHRTGRRNWDFAVEIGRLRVLRFTESDFRWLICAGYVEHAREVTRPQDQERRFRAIRNLSFSQRTCFILTELGAEVARRSTLAMACDCDGAGAHGQASAGRPGVERVTPSWDRERQELCIAGALVKRFKSPAVNQVTVLASFEEEDWPHRIDDPLPPRPEQDPKCRLHDTIKCLNRNQTHQLLQFRGDGTSEGVLWEFADVAGVNRA